MSQAFLGQIILFAGNFAPRGWALCNGQTLSIQQYTALFSILGTAYGGNGQTTFNLPDLRGRVPVGQGQGTGLSTYVLGQAAGTENVSLTVQQMPQHTHAVLASTAAIDVASPVNAYLGEQPASGRTTPPNFASTNPAPVSMAPSMISSQGGNQPHSNIQPILALNYIICIEGMFPSRN